MTREELLRDAKPILFSTDEVRATLDGRKTVKRLIVKPQLPDACPECMHIHNEFLYDKDDKEVYCARCGEPLRNGGFPYKAPYQPGDILYVRETDIQCCAECPIQKAFDRLAEYEDADEAGLIAACHCGDCAHKEWRGESGKVYCQKTNSWRDADDFCKRAEKGEKSEAD